MKNILTWFEIPVADMERAARFYEAVLAGSIKRETVAGELNGILPYERPGVGGALVLRAGIAPADAGLVVYLNVSPDLDAAYARALAHGARPIVPPTPPQPFGRIAWIVDCEGNRIGLHSA
jgi:hypothetical protein